ncbi:MAG: PKD domain-containing protein [Candidatus Krumholzibacteria bacterium]|nr:PKD domain-containing protein [Candidatus Krumholzibacteria bacterium]
MNRRNSGSVLILLVVLLALTCAVTAQERITDQKVKKLFDEYQALTSSQPEINPLGLSVQEAWSQFQALDEGPLHVRVMPGTYIDSQGKRQPYCWIGLNQTVWGAAGGGEAPYSWQWDFGDGTPPATGIAANASEARYIAVDHAYSLAGTRTAILTVTDNLGAVASRSVQIDIRVLPDPTVDLEVNAAIEKGLRWLYLNQYPEGYWPDQGDDYVFGATGAAVLAFELRGHLAVNDVNEDIYAEPLQRAFDFLMNYSVYYTLGSPASQNCFVDGNSNGLGVYFYSGLTYHNGLIMMAIAASRDPNQVATTGAVAGHTFRDILQDMCDMAVYAQAESPPYRGGWRYYVARGDGDSDNSAVQWPVLAMMAAGCGWDIQIPECVKTELRFWAEYSQCGNGGFGYTSPCDWPNIAKTGSGMISHAFLGTLPGNSSIVNALNFINANWGNGSDNNGYSEHLNGNIYAMYALTKGCRELVDENGDQIDLIGAHNWYAEYRLHLLSNPTWGQAADGHWFAQFGWWWDFGSAFSTATAMMILNPETVTCRRPVAVAVAEPDSSCANQPIKFDGSGSYHQDSERLITSWKWDFNAEDGIDWDHPDAEGASVWNLAGYELPPGEDTKAYQATLRVTDNSSPQQVSVATVSVTIGTVNHAPVACFHCPCSDAPYTARVGQEIIFDGSCSYDPDFLCTADSIVAWAWDLNGDGVFDDATTPITSFTWNFEYNGRIGLRAWDTHGAQSEGTAYVSVWTSHADLRIAAEDLHCSCGSSLDPCAITARVHCDTDDPSKVVASALVRFYDGNPNAGGVLIHETTLQNLTGGSVEELSVPWVNPDGQPHDIYVLVDPNLRVEEWDETNNVAIVSCGRVCDEQPNLSLIGYRTVDYGAPLWKVQVEIRNAGPGLVRNVNVVMNEEIDWLTIPDPNCGYSEIPEGGSSWGDDTYTFDLTNHPGGSFNVWFDVTYEDSCGKSYHVRLDPEFDPGKTAQTAPTLSFRLAQNYPNPFNPNTTISYQIPVKSMVNLSVFDVSGRLIRTLVNEYNEPGLYAAQWDGKDSRGVSVASGIYFSKLQAGNYKDTKRMVLLR